MKTFAALSLVAAAACAVDMVVENPYIDMFVPPVNLKDITEPNSG